MNKKRRIVVDSSVIVKWVSSQDEKYLAAANKILEDAKEEKIEVYTSELAKYEVPNALLTGKDLLVSQAYISLGTIYNIPITFVPESEELAQSTYSLAQQLKITYYDAAFLSIAKKYEATLVTDNIKDQRKSSEIKVMPLAKY